MRWTKLSQRFFRSYLKGHWKVGDVMLTACTEHEERINADAAQRQDAYFCPSCREAVILKRGSRMIAHFAHRANSVCRPFSESETQVHLTGKWQLADYFGVDKVELEPYLTKIAQRPDLLLTRNKRELAIEYQCSPIAISKLQQRNQGYASVELDVMWVLGEKYLQKMSQVRHAEKWLRYDAKLGWYMVFWQTQQRQLVIWHHVTVNADGQLRGWAKTSHGANYPQIQRGTPQLMAEKMQSQIKIGLHYKVPKWLRLQQFCYEHQSLLQEMPSLCFEFATSEPLMTDPPAVWGFLMLVLLKQRQVGALINQLDLEKWAAKVSTYLEGAQLIQCTTQQLIESWGRQLTAFVTLLIQRGILKQLDQKAWQLVATPY